MATGFGLDIGSESAYVVQDTGGIIRNELGGHSSGSLVAFNESERVIGEAAVGQQSSNPKNTLGDLHLLLGQSLAAVEASPRAPHLPFKRVASGADGKVAAVVNLRGEEMTFTPEVVLAMLLAQLKGLAATGSAASAGGGDAGRAAALAAPPAFGLAVPLWFGPEARVALRDAAAIAELGEGRVVLVDAPEALCHVFAQKHPVESAATAAPTEGGDGAEEPANSRVHLFVDVGATHATAVVARLFAPGAGPDGRTFEVLASASSPACGVQAYDLALFPLCRTKAATALKQPETAVAVPGTKGGLRLLRGVGSLRKLLSTIPEASVVVENIGDNDLDASISLTRQEFSEACAGVLGEFTTMLKTCLADAAAAAATAVAAAGSSTPLAFHSVEGLGGGMRMPPLQDAVQACVAAATTTASSPTVIGSKVDASALAFGAALVAAKTFKSTTMPAAEPAEAAAAAAVSEDSSGENAADTPPPAPPSADDAAAATTTTATSAAAVAEGNLPPGLSSEALAAAVADELAMATADAAVRAVAEARNGVESYVLSMRQAADDSKHGHLVTDRAGLMQALDDAENWLYSDEGYGAGLEGVQQQLASLKELVEGAPSGFCRPYLDAMAAEKAAMEQELEKAAAEEAASRFAESNEIDEDSEARSDRDTRKLSKVERMKKVMRHKETGNECFKTKAWQQAAKHYKEGLGHAKQLTEAPGYTEENDGAEVRALKVSLLLNLAQAWTKLDNQDQVLKCATDALAIDPVSPKALFRRAVVLEQRKDFDGAKADLKLAIQQPGAEKDKLITTLLQRVDIQIQRAKDKEKKMYGKMFS